MKRTLLCLAALLFAAPAFAGSIGTSETTFTIDSGATSTSADKLVFGGNGESFGSPADGTFRFTRNTSGSVLITTSDDDSNAATTIQAGGTGALTLGAAGNTSITLTTDGTGDGEVTVPASSISAQTELGHGILTEAIFCGDLGNNTTVYTSPVTGYPSAPFYAAGLTANDLDYKLAGTGCAAEDDTTEANADEVMHANIAMKALGMYCAVNSSGANGVAFHLRTAAGATTPDITCTIPTGQTECRVATVTTTNIAAGATVDVDAIDTEDLSASDFWCNVTFSLQ